MVKSARTIRSAKQRSESVAVRYVTDEDFSKTIASIQKMSRSEVVQSLKEVGILTRGGKLSAGYRQG